MQGVGGRGDGDYGKLCDQFRNNLNHAHTHTHKRGRIKREKHGVNDDAE